MVRKVAELGAIRQRVARVRSSGAGNSPEKEPTSHGTKELDWPGLVNAERRVFEPETLSEFTLKSRPAIFAR